MFTNASTNQINKFNHGFNCTENSLIYMLTCKIVSNMWDKQLISFAVGGIFIKTMTESI